MCPPTHYAIEYEINPWMKLRNKTNRSLAQKQWDNLVQILEGLGVEVDVIPQKKGCPDMVFTANAGVARGKNFYPSHFRYEERRPEEPAFIQYFKKKGYKIVDAAKATFFEGEGDLLPFRDTLFGGFGFRSEIAAHERIAALLKKRLVAVELATPRFYHLDTCFLPIDEESALYYPGAFDRYGRKAIKQFIKNPIPVGRRDAFNFACNGLRVGQTIVLNKASRSLKGKLARLDYDVIEAPTTEFMKAGGSVKCLVLKL